MKQHLRKLSALLLTLVLAISLAPAALAVPTVADTTITFGNVLAGDIVKAYPMVTYDATYSSLVYHPDFQAFLVGKKGSAAGTLDEWFETVGVDDLNKYLVEYTSKALAAGTATGYSLPTAGVVTGTAAGTSVDLTLKTGYYLILVQTTENNGKIYRPISIFLRVQPGSANAEVFANGNTAALTPDPATGYTINMKSEDAPVIAKKTRKSTDGNKWESNISASVGNTGPVEFYVEVKVPVYQGDPDLELTLNDTLQYMAVTFSDIAPYYAGLAVGTGIDSTSGELTGIKTGAVTGVTVNPYDAAAGTQKIQIKLDYSKLKNTAGGPYTVFYVHYYAILQKEAVKNDTAFGTSGSEKINAGKNGATLTYVSSADPAKPKTTAPVSVPVYTYSVKLDKQKADGTDLAGAKFRLYRDAAMTDADEVVLAKDAAGFYYPADHGAVGVEIGTGAESSFLIKGLDQGTYYLKETAAASGYFLPKNGFKIVLTGEGNATGPSAPRALTGKLAAASTFTAMDSADGSLVAPATVDMTAVNQLDIVLKNSSQPILPSTGGMGTALFTFGGVALMVLAAGLTIYMRKRKEN